MDLVVQYLELTDFKNNTKIINFDKSKMRIDEVIGNNLIKKFRELD
jgi:hypothetical protein